ncbi:glycosyltransferase family 28 protein, putative [Plasmodium sp. gorilla clade G3]|nr:glycosyltransferase family 28 protein, putative [Plasmodium sp. gorilla clade G3]
MSKDMYLFVTVGSTNFDELIKYIDDEQFHLFLRNIGFSYMTIQIGNGTYIPKLIYTNDNNINNNKLLKEVKYFTYKTNLDKYFEKAHFILSHSGAGTTLECLRKKKKILIVVNKKLMNNHQSEFANYMYSCNYLDICNNLQNLKQNIYLSLKKDTYNPFPQSDAQPFLKDLYNLIYN